MNQATPTRIQDAPDNKKSSFWRRYKDSIHFTQDLKGIFFRANDRHATIDGTRGITILLMVLIHVVFGSAKLMDDNNNLDAFIQGLPGWLDWAWQTYGSDPLFVICGLLISNTVFREWEKTQRIDIMRYYKRRITRIYPLFLLSVVIFALTNDKYPGYILSNLFFVSNYVPGHQPINPSGWSLEAQMQFYLLLPFLMLLLFAVRWKIVFLLGIIIGSFAYRYWVVASDPALYAQPFYMVFYDRDFAKLLADTLHYDLDVRIGNFFLGIFVAYLVYYHGKSIKAFLQRHPIVNTGLLAFGIFLTVAAISFPIQNKEADYYSNITTAQNFWFLVADRYAYCLGISIILFMVLCPAGLSNSLKRIFDWPVWHPFAQLIFPIYLFHFPFIAIAAVLIFGTTNVEEVPLINTMDLLLMFLISVALTMVFSVLTHIYIEKPAITLRDR